MLALLCDHGSPLIDVDADGSAPLHKALTQGHVEAARHLLAYGADAKQTLQVTNILWNAMRVHRVAKICFICLLVDQFLQVNFK